jgi:phage/plasmid-like protein (TIGR03299 family)
MAHELEILENGQASMAYAGEVPWHGLGVKVPSDVSPEQMLKKANLDWKVYKVPCSADINNEKVFVGRSALVRDSDHKILDVVSNEWNPVQNYEAFEFFEEYCRAGDMEMHTAGSLKGGQIVWVLAKVKESFDLFKGDTVESFLLFSSPHKFGQSIDVRFTPIRVVCNNTLTLSLETKSEQSVKVSHKKAFNADEVKETLGIATGKLAKYREMAAFLGSKRYSSDKAKEFFNTIFPNFTKKDAKKDELSRMANRAVSILETQPGAKFAEGTWWQPFNAVTYITDHVIGRSADTRLTSAWYGPNRSLKLKALEKAVEFAEAA